MNQTDPKRNMGEGEILEQRRSLAAPLIFFIVIVFQFATKRLQDLKKGASNTDKEIQLRGEIKQLLKEAASFSQPSTFAQAAKLRRSAAAKEKELANYQAQCSKEVKLSYDLYLKVLFILKVILCVMKLSRSFYMLVCLINVPRDTLSACAGHNSCCGNLLVLEVSCCFCISATCATLWEGFILEGWGFFKQQCHGWDHTLVDIVFQG
ncbi:hypothetical protein CRYUN_Cryun17cG0150400 [Craigia yunnanensis]